MRTIKLEKAWSYVTPQKTIDYPAGEHDVANEVAAKAEADGVIDGSLAPRHSAPDILDDSIPALTEHVAGITDAAEIDRLIAAENAGKTRRGALDVLDARKTELSGD